MLPGVLLHVIKPPRPVDAAQNIRIAGLSIDEMNNFVAVIADIKNVGIPDFPEIVWLPARGRIERRPIEDQSPNLPGNSGTDVRRRDFAMHNSRFEFFLESVVVIDSVCLHKIYASKARCQASEYL